MDDTWPDLVSKSADISPTPVELYSLYFNVFFA